MTRTWSVRRRLTVVYAVVVVASGAVLLALVYGLVAQAGYRTARVTRELRDGVPTAGPAPVPAPDVLQIREEVVGATLAQFLQMSGLALLGLTVVSVGIGWVVAGRVLAPVHTITARARRISADSLDERIALDGPHDELRALADTFDALLARVQATVESERRLVATMSHELRTPLANQQVVLDVALADPDAAPGEVRAAAATALEQSRRAARTVDALLVLARAQSGAAAGPLQRVDLRAVVADAVTQVRRPGDGFTWDLDLVDATVPGDPALLDRAVVNLVHNAAHHNVPGGHVRVRLTPAGPGTGTGQPVGVPGALDPPAPPDGADGLGTRGGDACVLVENTGPPVPPGTAADLVLPFRRGAADRTAGHEGVGLGLTVVRAVADHHGGRLVLAARPGGGLVAELRLPATPPTAGPGAREGAR